MLLQPEDFPDGWSSSSHLPDAGAATRQQKLAQCLGIKDSSSSVTGSLVSQDYTLGGARVWSTASRYATQASVTADVSAIRGKKFQKCDLAQLHQEVADQLPSSLSLKSVTLTIQTSLSGYPRNVAALAVGHFRAKARHSDTTVDGYVDVAYISGPLVEATVVFNSSKQRVDPDVERPLIVAVATRAAAMGKSSSKR
jgi:hypothetical protein